MDCLQWIAPLVLLVALGVALVLELVWELSDWWRN
jgi:hypothetical protein